MLLQVRLQSSNTNLPLDLNEPPAETLLHSSEKSVDELESTVYDFVSLLVSPISDLGLEV